MTIQDFEKTQALLNKEISNLRAELIDSIAKFKVGQKVKLKGIDKVWTIDGRLFENQTNSYYTSDAYKVLYTFAEKINQQRFKEESLEFVSEGPKKMSLQEFFDKTKLINEQAKKDIFNLRNQFIDEYAEFKINQKVRLKGLKKVYTIIDRMFEFEFRYSDTKPEDLLQVNYKLNDKSWIWQGNIDSEIVN